MKKIICAIVCLTLVLGMVGCKETNVGTADGEVPTLVWYVPGDPQQDTALVMEAANKIVEPAIGAKIDLQFLDMGSYAERMNMNMAAQADFDLLFVGWLYTYEQLLNSGGLLDISEIIKEEAPGLLELPDYVLKSVTTEDGKIYAIPNQQILAFSNAMAVRTDLAEKYDLNVDGMKPADVYEPFLKQVKENEPSVIPFRATSGPFAFLPSDFHYEHLYNNLIFLDLDTNKVFSCKDMPGYLDGAKKLHDWYKKGYIRSDVATVDDSGDYSMGRYAASKLVNKPGVEIEAKQATGYDQTIIPLTEPLMGRGDPLKTCIGVSMNSKHPEKAVKFIELINTNKELYNIICFGIEGKHYNWVDDTHISLVKSGGYCPNASWKFGNQFNAYLLEGQENDVWEKTKEINDNSVKSPLLGCFFDTSEILTELAQCDTVVKEYARIDVGTEDPDTYWDNYCKDLKDGGIDKIVQTFQSQVDAYLNR